MTNGKLLILDDDPHIGKLVKLIGEASGLEARFTLETGEFFRAVDEWRPTHIVLDLVMPSMEGTEVLFRLAQRCCRARIILSSGVGEPALDAAGRSANENGLQIVGTLAKPFSLRALRELLAPAG